MEQHRARGSQRREYGPGVGRWLARARRRVLEEPGENQRERLLDWLRREAGS